ncbi:uncharacterized PE-PGRS family protein PE_PGRS54-like [Dreissena polymorpha]|uniref:uncharacterized PE-PGRS family protein PE_PGRS54-like n=1 Tax=Dreissena polymorpha TaxID=45954 RepID=UPI002264635A|nr:uncharacterized PE-PGRS family protein PE_PGRS54-like [Dreissena polymorpha]
MNGFLCVLGVFLCACAVTQGRPNGAPKEACFYMTPRHLHPHTSRRVFPTQALGLYNITTSADVFRPDRPIRVTLWGPPFKGFMLIAAEEGSKDWPTGIFYSEDGMAQRMDCLGRGDTVTHQNNSYKDSVSVLWYGPESLTSEQVQFVATVVVNLTIYYTNIRSGFIRLDPSIHGVAPGGAAEGQEVGAVAVTMDPWLQGSVTQAPTNWWGRQGSGNSWGSGASGNLPNSWGGSGARRGNQMGSWGAGAAGGGNMRAGGSSVFTSGSSDWQQWGQGSLTSSAGGGNKKPTGPQVNNNGGRAQWATANNGAGWGPGNENWGGVPMDAPNPSGRPIWNWSKGQITSPAPSAANPPAAGSALSVSAIMELLSRLTGVGGQQTPVK